jgi:glycogen debranching enzyme
MIYIYTYLGLGLLFTLYTLQIGFFQIILGMAKDNAKNHPKFQQAVKELKEEFKNREWHIDLDKLLDTNITLSCLSRFILTWPYLLYLLIKNNKL